MTFGMSIAGMLAALVLASTSGASMADSPIAVSSGDIFSANRKLGRGINLGNALEAPNEGEWGVTLKAEYFAAIRSAGFDTVRLPVKWSAHALHGSPYTINPTFAARVDWAVGQALGHGLQIIVNVHHYDELYASPEKHMPRLAALWAQIAARYQSLPHGVVFELLNEPHGKLTEARWNAAIAELLAIVRKTNPARPVIVGSGRFNSIAALDKLKLPEDDRNLILTFHYYDPGQFTHQGAHFMKGADQWKGRMWTGTIAEQEAVRAAFAKVAAWARAGRRPVFLGEFGTYREADIGSRARWTRFVARESERLGFSWAYWEFGAGFGAYDVKTDSWLEPLRSALLDLQ